MPVFTYDCPHCGARKATFSLMNGGRQPNSHLTNALGTCPACFNPIALIVFMSSGTVDQLVGDLTTKSPGNTGFVMAVYPSRKQSISPAHVPPAAAKSFVEGGECLSDGRYTSAVAMFRRSLEICLKNFSPDIEAWKLEKRIDKLADKGLITPDLKTWAHKIRLEGNEAVHEEDEPTREAATELQLFTEMVMTYLYTLPAKVQANLPSKA